VAHRFKLRDFPRAIPKLNVVTIHEQLGSRLGDIIVVAFKVYAMNGAAIWPEQVRTVTVLVHVSPEVMRRRPLQTLART